MYRRHSFLAIASISLVGMAAAQDVEVYGRVREQEQPQPITGATMDVSSDGVQLFRMLSDSTGFYRIGLDVGRVWRIRFAAPGRVAKLVEFDLGDLPANDGGYGMNVDMRLFKEDAGKDFSFLDEPLGICRYDSATTMIKWDMDYTGPRMVRMREMVPEVYTIDTDSVSTGAQDE